MLLYGCNRLFKYKPSLFRKPVGTVEKMVAMLGKTIYESTLLCIELDIYSYLIPAIVILGSAKKQESCNDKSYQSIMVIGIAAAGLILGVIQSCKGIAIIASLARTANVYRKNKLFICNL